MYKTLLNTALFFLLAGSMPAQEHGAQGARTAAEAGPQSQPSRGQSSSGSDDSAVSAPANPQESVAEAARKARERKQATQKAAKVFTNDNIPASGGTPGAKPEDTGQGSSGTPASGSAPAGASGTSNRASDEKAWREKFAGLRHKLEQDQQQLEVMQRELGVLNVQYYNDPVKAMQQQLTRSDINQKSADIEKKKMDIAGDQQALDDAEDDLRKAGGDPGWAR